MKRKIIDWGPIEEMAKTGDYNYRELSDKFGHCVSTIKGHCNKIGLPLGNKSPGRGQVHDWAQIDPLLKAIPMIMDNVAKVRELHRKYLNIPWFSFISRYYGVHRERSGYYRDNSGHVEVESRAPAQIIEKQLPASMETKRQVMEMDPERFSWWMQGPAGRQWAESIRGRI